MRRTYCASVEWVWGDDTRSESKTDCEPYEAGRSEIKRRYTLDHIYQSAGNTTSSSTSNRRTSASSAARRPSRSARELGISDRIDRRGVVESLSFLVASLASVSDASLAVDDPKGSEDRRSPARDTINHTNSG